MEEYTLLQKSLATLDSENVDPEIAVKLEIRDGMYLKYTVHILNITPFDTSNVMIFYVKLG